MDGNRPLVSIITVNYNSTATTVDLLLSAKYLTYPNVELIVVDNASREDPTPALAEAYPDVKVVLSPKNLGFAGGNNLGIRMARGEYLFFVNNDTVLTADLLEGLVDTCLEHPDAGVVSPKFHYYHNPGTIEFAGYGELNVFTGRHHMVGTGEKDYGQHDTAGVTHSAHGGGMMVPVKVASEVGPMPEMYFLYYEELDWCAMIKRRGYRVYYQPRSLIYHKESMTVGKKSVLKTFYLSRNRILFMRRNVGIGALSVFTLYLIFFTIPKNSAAYLFRKELEHLKAFWRGLLWNLVNAHVRNA